MDKQQFIPCFDMEGSAYKKTINPDFFSDHVYHVATYFHDLLLNNKLDGITVGDTRFYIGKGKVEINNQDLDKIVIVDCDNVIINTSDIKVLFIYGCDSVSIANSKMDHFVDFSNILHTEKNVVYTYSTSVVNDEESKESNIHVYNRVMSMSYQLDWDYVRSSVYMNGILHSLISLIEKRFDADLEKYKYAFLSDVIPKTIHEIMSSMFDTDVLCESEMHRDLYPVDELASLAVMYGTNQLKMESNKQFVLKYMDPIENARLVESDKECELDPFAKVEEKVKEDLSSFVYEESKPTVIVNDVAEVDVTFDNGFSNPTLEGATAMVVTVLPIDNTIKDEKTDIESSDNKDMKYPSKKSKK